MDLSFVVQAVDVLHAGLGGGANPATPGDLRMECPGFHGWQLGALERSTRTQDDCVVGWAVPVPQVATASN